MPTMKLLVENPRVSCIYFGGARGVDTKALLAALNFRKDPTLKFVVVVPYTVEDQPPETHEVTRLADEVVELNFRGKMQYIPALRKRNQYMVDRADKLLALSNGDKQSGTWQAIRMAHKQDKPVQIVDIRVK